MKNVKFKLPPVITAANHKTFYSAVVAALKKKAPRVVLDARKLVFSANTERFFLALARRAEEFRGVVEVRNVGDTLYNALLLTDVDKFLKVTGVKRKRKIKTAATPKPKKKRTGHARKKK